MGGRMSGRLARWHEIQQCKRGFKTLHTGERVYYRVTGFTEGILNGRLEPFVKIVPEIAIDGRKDGGIYPVKAFWFVTATGEVVK